MGGRQDREVAAQKVQPNAAMERRRAIVVALTIAEGLFTPVSTRVNIEQGIDMRVPMSWA
jgi:hypothetical protein